MRGHEQEKGLSPSERKKLLDGLSISKGVAVTGIAALAVIFVGNEIRKRKKRTSQTSPSSKAKSPYRRQ